MRRHLVAAVALAPLCLVAGAARAQSTETITSSLNAPIATATAVSGGPGDIDITTGSVTVTGTTPAVTLNSSNTVLNSGAITISGVNSSTDVLVNGGYTGAVTNTGSITNTESFSPTTNSDGFSEEPFVSTTSADRYGVRLTGTSAFVGSIVNSGTITVRGNSSYAVSLEAPMTGSFVNSGTIALTGDNSIAVRSIPGATITGAAEFTGAVTTLGQNTSAVNLQGDVTGAVSVYSTISSTGYAETTRPTTTSQLTNLQATSTQIEQSAGAVVIGGNVGGGIFIGAPPVGTTTTSSGDLDGDGIADDAEGSGTIVNYGSAPALLVGASGTGAGGQNATVIGEFGTTDSETAVVQPANAYGLIIRGAVSGMGVYDGVSATGLQLGTGMNGATTLIDGGVRVVGSVSADSYEADATAIHLYSGLTTPVLRNEDYIEASISHSILVSTSTATSTATGVLINTGATLPSIVNYGTIQATANGDHMSAYGVRDLSGSTTSVLNEGVIDAAVTPVTSGILTSGSTVALDLSANTTGVTLTQMVNPNPIAIEVTTTTSTSGVVSTTAALTTATASTTSTTTTTTAGVTTTTTTTTPTYPQIIGDVLLGSGTNNVQLLGGSVAGALSLGGGQNDVLTIGNDTTAGLFTGALTNVNASTGVAGTGLALTVANGTLVNTATGMLNLSSLTVGSKGILYAAIDPSNASAPTTLYNVAGTASLASGSQLGIVLKTPLFNETTYTVVQAGTLSDASGGTSLLSTTVPYVLVGTEESNAATGQINIDLRRRTAVEMQLDPAESSALNAVYASLPNDPDIEEAVLGTYTRSSFLGVYDQLLPDYAGGVFQLSLAASDAVTRATSRVNDIENPSGTRGAWTEEVAFGVNRNRDAESAGYQGGGFGFVGGLETGGLGLGAFGLTGAFLTGDIKDPHSPGDNLSSFSEGEGGAYWQGQLGGFRGDARVGAGYVLFSERRELLLENSLGDTTLDRQAKGNSSGYSLTGHFGLGYQTGQIGWFYFRPEVHGDYFRLNQGSFTERYGGDGFDLSLASRDGNQTSGEAALVTGLSFGQGFRWRPELELGYRDVFTGTAGDTTAAFANGSSFTLTPPSIRGGGPVGRLDVKADTDFYELNFEAGAEQRADFVEADVRVAVRVLF